MMVDKKLHFASITRFSRREILVGGVAASFGMIAGLTGNKLVKLITNEVIDPDSVNAVALNGDRRIPFYGKHQTGISVSPQSYTSYLIFNLRKGLQRKDLQTLLRNITKIAAKLTQGSEENKFSLTNVPARLTVTVGIGKEFIKIAAGGSFIPPELQLFTADFLIHLASDDLMTNTSALRIIQKAVMPYAQLQEQHSGFRRAYSSVSEGADMQNLLGARISTANLDPDMQNFAERVWIPKTWLKNGTNLVIQRLEFDLIAWQKLSSSVKLSKLAELDVSQKSTPNFVRSYNFDSAADVTTTNASIGLILFFYKAQLNPLKLDNLVKDFIPNSLQEYIKPISRQGFVLPAGCAPGDYLGKELFKR